MTNPIFLKIPRILLLFVFLLSLVSCGGQKPMVSDVKIQSEYVDADLHLSLEAKLSIGNVVLPQTSLPILMPKTFKQIGTLSMTSLIGGENYLNIDVNVSSIANIQGSQTTLPNGSILPLIADNKVITIPIGNSAQLYLTLSDGVAALGVAIPFKTFDSIGAKVGTSSLFPVFNIDNILGAAGIYTSDRSGKNGFGLFVDLSNTLDPIDFVDLGSALTLMSAYEVEEFKTSSSLNFSSIIPPARQERSINRELLKMHQRKKRLQLR
jgi:hypothetical protein